MNEKFNFKYSVLVLSLLLFAANLIGFVAYRTSVYNDIFGGDTINISIKNVRSYAVHKNNLTSFDEFLKELLSGENEDPAKSPNAFIYNKLSEEGRDALKSLNSNPEDIRSEEQFLLEFNRSLVDKKIEWPKWFPTKPILSGYGIFGDGVREVNLRALAAVYSIVMPISHVAKMFHDEGVWKAIKEINFRGFFYLATPTRYSPVVNAYVGYVQSYFLSGPGKIYAVVTVAGILYASFITFSFLLAWVLIGSKRWAFLATIFAQLAFGTLTASYQLFSLPYLTVPLVMEMAFFAYLMYKKQPRFYWLLILIAASVVGPWIREFSSAIPFIIFACEILSSKKRSKVVLLICLPLMAHSLFPSYITWLVGLNEGIYVGVSQQGNVQHVLGSWNFRHLGLLFVQFPPVMWFLVFTGTGLWLWRGFAASSETTFALPIIDKKVTFEYLNSRYGKLIMRRLPFVIFVVSTVVFLYSMFIYAAPQSNWSAKTLSMSNDLLAVLTILSLAVIVGASLRFGVLAPVYFAAVFLPFLRMNLAEVHLSFAVLPLSVIFILWIRYLFTTLKEIEPQTVRSRRLRLAAYVVLVVAITDQAFNIHTTLTVQNHLANVNKQMSDWIVENTDRHSVVLANFMNYTDIYYYSGDYFDPWESVGNNPLGYDKSVDADNLMRDLLTRNFGLRDIYFLAGEHDYYDWQRGYHSHRWVNKPPGKIKRLAYFPGKKYYYYVDPFKYFIPRNFISFPGYMDWDTDFYFNNDRLPFRRVVDVKYTMYKLTKMQMPELTKETAHAKVEAFPPILIQESVGPNKDLNIVRYTGLFYAVPQSLGAVDWGNENVAEIDGVATAKTLKDILEKASTLVPTMTASAAGSKLPILMQESVGKNGNINIVSFKGLFYAVPQRLGAVDWENENVAKLDGVATAKTLKDILEKASTLAPTIIAAQKGSGLPKLIMESLGQNKDINVVEYKGIFYGVPQKLGAVDWLNEDVAAMDDVVTAKTRDEILQIVATLHIAAQTIPQLVQYSTGPNKNMNIFKYNGLFYAIPQQLGEVDLKNENVVKLVGVVTANTLEEIIRKIQ